jgi:hypothetical protein
MKWYGICTISYTTCSKEYLIVYTSSGEIARNNTEGDLVFVLMRREIRVRDKVITGKRGIVRCIQS